MNILDQIVEKRKKQIEEKGWNFGIDIPEKRLRPLVPFMQKRGLILEVKRASPSKGHIAPDLDSVKTALTYADAGARAISVLTEENYFKGSLRDLIQVGTAIGSKEVSLLRKDFLIDPVEIEIAYRCGADAVLLIARILSAKQMLAMAKKCQELGMTAFVEIRLQEDLDKLKEISLQIDPNFIVCGVNARDLKDFSIDLLTPAAMLNSIRNILGPKARIIFESGITSPQAATFASSLGFSGLLLGEAAARNPQLAPSLVSAFSAAKSTANSAFWLSFAEKLRVKKENGEKGPFVKICGLTSAQDALHAASEGACFLGFVFYHKSKRSAQATAVKESALLLEKQGLRGKVTLVAVIVDPASAEAKEAYSLLQEGFIDIIQCHGIACAKEFLADKELCNLPHYCAVNVSSQKDLEEVTFLSSLGEPRILLDSSSQGLVGGSGKRIESQIIEDFAKQNRLWLAGGVDADNVSSIISHLSPELVDTASGVEQSPGVKDKEKVSAFLANCN